MDLQEPICRLGLTKRAGAIYLACLEHGPETVAAIARHAGEKRSTTRYTIDELLQRGLLTLMRKGRRTLYDAQRPQKLLTLLYEEERELQHILPQLEELRGKREPIGRVYLQDDREGLRTLYREIYDYINTPEGVCFLASMSDLNKYAPFALDIHLQVLKDRRSYNMRELILDEPAGRQWLRTMRSHHVIHPCRFLPSTALVANDLALFGTKVSLFSFRKRLSAVVIDDPRIVQTLRALFDIVWEQAEEIL